MYSDQCVAKKTDPAEKKRERKRSQKDCLKFLSLSLSLSLSPPSLPPPLSIIPYFHLSTVDNFCLSV